MKEIERRFRINTLPQGRDSGTKQDITQGYLKADTRIRKTTEGQKSIYTKTIKHDHGLVREEIESKISLKEFKVSRLLAKKISLSKTRYFLPYKKNTIELNIFDDNLKGLLLAEIEFTSIEESKAFEIPERFGPEITEHKESTSHYLAKHGKSDLEKIINLDRSKHLHDNCFRKKVVYSLFEKLQVWWGNKLRSSKTEGSKPYEQRIHEDLAEFYNHEARKYASTRKKIRLEGDIFVNQIKSYPKDSVRILELGCGSGRFLEQLNSVTDKDIDYTGIDLSTELLKEAEKIKISKNIHKKFIVSDMIDFLKGVDQESYDIIIGIASIQHLPTKKSRLLCTKYSYRALHYGGLFVMSNRSFSVWFIQKYRKTFIETATNILWRKEMRERNSFLLPRKTESKTFKRFYHIFTRNELRYITEKAGFSIQTLKYINKQGELSENRKEAKNTLMIAEKNIFLDEKI